MALKAGVDYPGAVIPVFERTLTCQAAEQFWKSLLEFDELYKLGIKFHHTLKTATLPTKATIQLMGADTIEAADKGRGGKYPLVIVDEIGTYRPRVAEYLLQDVVEPATMDYNGAVVLAGTPPAFYTDEDIFYRACRPGSGWSHHHWTALDNPHIPRELGPSLTDEERLAYRMEWLAGIRERNGWTEATPKYRREYMGEWASEDGDMVFRWDSGRNLCPTSPNLSGAMFVLGIDVGHNDPCAFVVLAVCPGDSHIYVIESYQETGLIPSAVAARVARLQARYTFTSIVVDTGGLGKGYAEEMKQRYHIPVRAAQKRQKAAYIEYLNGDLSNGTIQAVQAANRELIADVQRLPWNDDHTDAHSGYPDHLPDALLYAYREMRGFTHGLGARDKAEWGSPEWQAEQEAAMDAVAQEAYESRLRVPVEGSWAD